MKIRLFTIPYSGSSASIYLSWKRLLPDQVEVVPLELPGRGKRFGSKLCQSMSELIEDLYSHIQNQLDGQPYAVFGHSLGGLVAYELCVKLMENGHHLPMHLFLSGCNPPHLRYGEENLHTLPDALFLQEIAKLGGITPELQVNPEVMRVFVPIIKSDYKIYELYAGKGTAVKLPIDFSVLAGKNDPLMPVESGREWKKYTKGSFRMTEMEGGHFFIHDQLDHVINAVESALIVHK
ncbi:thioesterase II family protein [Paenibacillus tuaregi]|uniref:thioesterase II family protein n=1 Tax=Paenibacillus tuaregi TaxID=1816681 RepID=UPI0008380435|nr:alpha/beta fold hydrolase [Paenibacillus tuaregi]